MSCDIPCRAPYAEKREIGYLLRTQTCLAADLELEFSSPNLNSFVLFTSDHLYIYNILIY